jgi:hypothetical protein
MWRNLNSTLTSPPPQPSDVTYDVHVPDKKCVFSKTVKTLARFPPRWQKHDALPSFTRVIFQFANRSITKGVNPPIHRWSTWWHTIYTHLNNPWSFKSMMIYMMIYLLNKVIFQSTSKSQPTYGADILWVPQTQLLQQRPPTVAPQRQVVPLNAWCFRPGFSLFWPM